MRGKEGEGEGGSPHFIEWSACHQRAYTSAMINTAGSNRSMVSTMKAVVGPGVQVAGEDDREEARNKERKGNDS